MSMNKKYGVGLLFLFLGIIGLSAYIISEKGSFMLSTIVFSIGFALILDSYVKRK